MTHRDGVPRVSARSAWRGDAGHRKPWAPSQSHGPSESLGKPPFRSRGRTAGGRRKALTMPRRTRGFPPTRPMARRIRPRDLYGSLSALLGIIRQAVLQVLQAGWDPTFSEHSFGFRANLSAH